uniref:LNR domain-containing protein n=1 Tax=Peronospora matthiolae TaxID=2874970 RepID=A0AAV1T4Q8_9STRA
MTAPQSHVATPVSSRFAPRSSWPLLVIFFSGVLATCVVFLVSDWQPVDRRNIGNVPSSEFLAYGPIDVVYTWVNGTDPRWKKEKEFWHKHWIASLTGQPLPVWGQDADVKGHDDSNADNRFRDNEELRYSLRSLEKYAPWVRHIYVVTDGQIPSWLDIESPQISIVKHGDIFMDPSHLPVFSSPAIEWNLDNIPGLSDMFLYFNDDVFLGAPVRPEDFVSQAGVQKAYFAWEIPLCATRCEESRLANGRCDASCNVTACDFDMGDCGCDVNPLDGAVTCDAEKIAKILEDSPKPSKMSEYLCQGACNYQWLGNGVCNQPCNVSSCAFDGGDCKVQNEDHGHQSQAHGGVEEDEERLSPLVKELWSADISTSHTLVHVPLDVNSTYLNFTDAFGVNGSIWSAAHDNEKLIRFASVYETEMVLLLVFGRDSEAHPMTSSVQISVVGEDAEENLVELKFLIVRGEQRIEPSFGPAQVGLATLDISGGMFTYQNTSIRPNTVRLPFEFRQATFCTAVQSPGDDVEHTMTTETVESKDAAVVDGGLFGDAPQVEIFLPLNVTGKELRNGDILSLGWHTYVRLHNDEEDIHWRDEDVCQLWIPTMENPTDVPGASDNVVGDGTEKVDVIVDSSRASSSDGTKMQSDTTCSSDDDTGESQDEKTCKQRNAILDSANGDAEAAFYDADSEIAKCRLASDNKGIIVTVRMLPPHAHSLLLATSKVDEENEEDEEADEEEEADADDTYQGMEDSSMCSVMDNAARTCSETDVAMEEGGKVDLLVTDGHICFFDTNDADPSRYRYCFALAMGHFYSEQVEIVHKPTLWALLHPPKPKVVYTPYMGDDPALLELFDQCIDSTTRSIGVRPPICYPNEEPVLHPSDKEASEVDVQNQLDKEADGRQLACEAQRRRLAQHKEHDQDGREARAKDGILGTLASFYEDIKLALGIGHVVPTTDSLTEVEYADVCGPLSVPASEDKHEVTLENAQAHLSKDTFGDSLRFVNKLYNRVFGKPTTSDRRRVPSHMPFLLQKSMIREIKDYWTKEVNDTSAHRFRHPQDMQFSFSYFHYLINRAKIHPHTLEEVWHEYIDANRNGILDEDEVLTAASLAHGDAPSEAFVADVRKCVQPEKREKARETLTAEGTLRLTETLTPHITLENLERCPEVRDALIKNVRYESMVELMPETEVTFHMLSDNYKFAWKQMMGTRARRTKFVCINDDMKNPSTAVSQILHELFLSIWPKRSQFELPYHLKNRYAHIDEYHAAQARRQVAAWIAVTILLLLAFVCRNVLRAMFGFQDIARARAASASQLAQEFQQEVEGRDEPSKNRELDATTTSS